MGDSVKQTTDTSKTFVRASYSGTAALRNPYPALGAGPLPSPCRIAAMARRPVMWTRYGDMSGFSTGHRPNVGVSIR